MAKAATVHKSQCPRAPRSFRGSCPCGLSSLSNAASIVKLFSRRMPTPPIVSASSVRTCASQRPQISAARPSSHPAARATAAASEVPTGWEVNSTMRQGGTILRDDIRRAPCRTTRSDPAPEMQTAPSAISRLATILSTSRIMGLAFIVSNIWFYVVRIRSRPRPPSSAAMRSPQRQGVSAPAGSYRRPAR